MLVSNVFRRLLLQPNALSTAFFKPSSSVAFGNAEMPDKLYKKIELEVRSFERSVMKSYEKFVRMAANHLQIDIGKTYTARKPKYERYTILKSVFVHRKHMVQYEVRTYYMWINLFHLTGSTADTFLEYIERMLPEGVALKVTKVSVEPLPPHLTKTGITNSEQSATKS